MLPSSPSSCTAALSNGNVASRQVMSCSVQLITSYVLHLHGLSQDDPVHFILGIFLRFSSSVNGRPVNCRPCVLSVVNILHFIYFSLVYVIILRG